MQRNIKDVRMELWCNVWVAVASSSNVRDCKTCANWADNALNDFDKRFKEDAEQGVQVDGK
jgi:hypothetical protein